MIDMTDAERVNNLRTRAGDALSQLTFPSPIRWLTRALTIIMILVLLTVRLGSFGEQVFVTPVEDAIFDIASVTVNGNESQTKPLSLNSKCTLDCDLPQCDVSFPYPLQVSLTLPAHVPFFSPQVVGSEIFIPPEGLV